MHIQELRVIDSMCWEGGRERNGVAGRNETLEEYREFGVDPEDNAEPLVGFLRRGSISC